MEPNSPEFRESVENLTNTNISLPPLVPNKVLSGIRDLDLKAMSYWDDRDLFTFCKNFESKNRYINKLCKDENFWRQKIISKYGEIEKDEKRTWKNLYLKIAYYNDKFQQAIAETRENMVIGSKVREDILREKEDIINFFSNYLGIQALEELIKFIENDQITEDFEIYTGYKNSPITWNPDYDSSTNTDFMFSYPSFPGKPKISKPITREEFDAFNEAFEKYVEVPYNNDSLLIGKEGGKYMVTSERSDDVKEYSKKDLIDLLRKISKVYRIDIIAAPELFAFDIRDYLAPGEME